MPSPRKPKALHQGSRLRIISPASPAPRESIQKGMDELRRLAYEPEPGRNNYECNGYFAGSTSARSNELLAALRDPNIDAMIASRGGYGSNYLLESLLRQKPIAPKALIGFSDTTTLSCFFWKKWRWVTFYGPMAAAGFDSGADAPNGYDSESFARAVTQTRGGWKIDLRGESLVTGEARGILLGGCLTLLQTSLATPWELEPRGTILAIEDRGVRPYQIDRMLMHLLQAGKFRGVRAVILGDFPDCEPKNNEGPTVRDVCARILGPFKIPVVWGAPIGHTRRAMITLPLGVRAKVTARGGGTLEILEPAVRA
ncbi:MAG TPA: LD-carboxypeptidase [Candidatus Acidoferrales bacterium]|nr:LD-carboxypeptidase [Candidatus Acidoferrales bacterium]